MDGSRTKRRTRRFKRKTKCRINVSSLPRELLDDFGRLVLSSTPGQDDHDLYTRTLRPGQNEPSTSRDWDAPSTSTDENFPLTDADWASLLTVKKRQNRWKSPPPCMDFESLLFQATERNQNHLIGFLDHYITPDMCIYGLPPDPIPSLEEFMQGAETRNQKSWGILYSNDPFADSSRLIYLIDDTFIMSRNRLKKWELKRNHKFIPGTKLKKISPFHFVLSLIGTSNLPRFVRLTDLSVSGTYVNGKKVGRRNSVTLFDGDEIVIANLVDQIFTFRDFSNKDMPPYPTEVDLICSRLVEL